MEKLTDKQMKQVIEFFGAQASEDAPDSEQGQPDWDTHAWKTRYTASLAIGRRITEHDWHVLITAGMDLQSFDRDPEGYMHERGEDTSTRALDSMSWTLKDLVSFAVDEVIRNSGA